MSDIVEWACPECGMGFEPEHTAAEKEQCSSVFGTCGGFICECDHVVDKGHGDSLADRCLNASCGHCGWGGEFPPIPWTKKDLPTWAKTALNEGWAPPKGWEPTPKKGATP